MKRLHLRPIKRKANSATQSATSNPSPWIGVSTGIVGAVCGLVSMYLSVNSYIHNRPKFIIDIQSDFKRAPVSLGKNGIPISDYSPNGAGFIVIPCDLINTGEKSEVVRYVKAEAYFGQQYIGTFEQREPISVGAKQVTRVDLAFNYCSAHVTSNQGTLRVSLVTSLGMSEYEKNFHVFAICRDP